MRACILLSGLQRNFEPFIENQLNLVIRKYDLDVFIYTSSENLVRYSRIGDQHTSNLVDYVKRDEFTNDEQFFRNKYGDHLKSVYIDRGNHAFNQFLRDYAVSNTRNHTTNVISAYFKIMECIKLMERYESQNGFKYDAVLRARLDFFVLDDFFNLADFDPNVVYMPISKFNGHRDDSGFLANREVIHHFKHFINRLTTFDDTKDYINIEKQIMDFFLAMVTHMRKTRPMSARYIPNLTYRIGVGCNVEKVPYYNPLDKDKLFSLEYRHEL